jgi:hypothetical protein
VLGPLAQQLVVERPADATPSPARSNHHLDNVTVFAPELM